MFEQYLAGSPSGVHARHDFGATDNCPGARGSRFCRLLAALVMAGWVSMCLDSAAAQTQPSKPAPESHYQTARAAGIKGNTDRAILQVRLALQDDPLAASSHFLFGCLLEQQGESEQAIVAFQRAVALDPTNPEALYNLGTMLLWRGEALPASRLLESAVLIRPDHVPSYNNLAKAYYLAGLSEFSLASYEEVLRMDPSNGIALKNLVLLNEASGDYDAADTYQDRLEKLNLDPASKSVSDAAEPTALPSSQPLDIAVVATESPKVAPPQLGKTDDIAVVATETPKVAPPQLGRTDDTAVSALQELLGDLPHVSVERRAGRLVLTGWTIGPTEREMLDRILRVASNVLDLTSDDTGDPRRMIEIDAVVFVVTGGPDSKSEGFNFLSLIDLNFNYFASDHNRAGTGFSAPGAIGAVSGLSQQGWMFAAAADYSVEIANASSQRVTVLARPHLTTVSGTPASFHAGGEIVFQVSGMNTGDIKPFPFGTSLKVTPTLLRTPAADGSPRVHIAIEAGRSSVLSLLGADSDLPVTVDKILTTSQAVVDMGHTLILSGFSQKQTQTKRSGVPGLMSVPILKYFFSTKSTVVTNSAVVILLTPRDPVFWGAEYNKSFTEFVQRRRDFLRAMQGTEQDLKSFRERYPDWDQLPPSRLSTHAILMENSVFYRNESGQNLTTTPLDLRVLSEEPETK